MAIQCNGLVRSVLGVSLGIVLMISVYADDLPKAAEKPAKGTSDSAESIVPPQPLQEFADDFDADTLDQTKWIITRKNDFAEFAADIAPPAKEEQGRRLRLRCGTIGTHDDTVKFLGVATQAPLDLSGKRRLQLDFDWNKQANGSYLTGAIYLCPTLTKGNPADEKSWLRLEYIGVPPGKNVRAAIWMKNKERQRWIYDEGWPKTQRKGRTIDKVHIEFHFDNGQWKVTENGKELFASSGKGKLPFDKAYLYLQMSSHSNYPPREIFFDKVIFEGSKPSGT